MNADATIRSVPADMAAPIVARIDATLDALAREHGVAVPWAVESGSRAWGFPSPDSDYDCRFVFVRPLGHLLSPWPRRDVIESPIDRDLDVNGWDLGKALKLLLNGNAVIVEWLMSPVVYAGDADFRAGFLDLARAVADRRLIGRHYLHLGRRHRQACLGDGPDVPVKTIFYALRPAAALRWLRLHPDRAIAPMHFPTLMAEGRAPADVATLATELMSRKAMARERSAVPLPPVLATFMDAEFEAARAPFDHRFIPVAEDGREAADRFFREAVKRFDR